MGSLQGTVSVEYLNSLTGVETDWQELVQGGAARHIFLTPFWARCWWQCLGSGQLRFLKVKAGGKVVGMIPTLTGDGVTTLLGDKEVCDYLDILALPGEEGTVVKALLDDFERTGGVLELFPLRPDSIIFRYLPSLASEYGYNLQTEIIDVSFAVELPGSWEAYLSLLKGKDRHELRRKLRNLFQAGHIDFYSLRPNSADMEDFFRLFRLSREDKRLFMTGQRELFFRRVSQEGGARGWVRLSFLEIDRKRVAAALCFDFNGVVSLYNSGYDPDYAPLSVGLLCKAMTIQEAIEKGRKTYDFLRGAEDYKFHLGGKPFSIYRAVLSQDTHKVHY